MLQKIKSGLLCSAILFSFNTWATSDNLNLTVGHEAQYQFPAKAELVVSNYVFYTINANCDVKTENTPFKCSSYIIKQWPRLFNR